MLKQRTDSINRSFRHQQGEEISQALLSKTQEQRLAQKISRYRRAFERKIISEPAVVEYFIKLLIDLQSKKRRLDTVCNFGLSETDKRKQVEPRIGPCLKLLQRLRKQLAHPISGLEGRRLHRRVVAAVEPLMIRPGFFESAPFLSVKASELRAEYRTLCRRLVCANMRLVTMIANRICGDSSVLADMIQEGNRGLMHAVTKFDHHCDVRFATYATPWIKQAILGALVNAQRNIRVPENFRAISRRVQKQIRVMQTSRFEFCKTDSGQTIMRLADQLKMRPADVARHLRIQRDTCSLDSPTGANLGEADASSALCEVLEDRRQCNPMEIAQDHERARFVRKLMAQALTRRERDVISLRFGFKDGKDRSFAEVGREVGLTRQRVCQVEKQALAKLGKITERMDFSCV